MARTALVLFVFLLSVLALAQSEKGSLSRTANAWKG